MFITNLSDIEKSKLDVYMEKFLDWLMDKALDVFIALIFIFVGTKLVKLLVKMLKRSFSKAGMESSVLGFLISLIRGALYAVVFIMAAAIMGFQVTSLVTILGTASLAVGLALQGSLANFAGGVLILLMKPFRVGDYIIENDKKCEGEVVSIDIFYTKLKTYDNKIVVIPNGNITANSLINLTAESVRKLDITVGVAYDSDIKLVKTVLENIMKANEYYEEDEEANVFVSSFGESAIIMGVRFYVKTENYWQAKWDVTEQIKLEFDCNNISIPYNQLEVKVTQSNDET
ncbi:MAG: mechanosensitive ion channel [Clostridium sp.]|nr:mechanosensitive ion channel [Clostridium sp.]MCM1459329.1 mechanosensitive ion channel [Bacteroides sp.]